MENVKLPCVSERTPISEAEKHVVRLSAFEKRLDRLKKLEFSDPYYMETVMVLCLLATSMGAGSFTKLASLFQPVNPLSR